MSRILEDEQGFHIIRVKEREEAHRTPFIEAQTEIKEKIQRQRRKEQVAAMVARLRKEIPVWTIFDDQAANTQVPATATGGVRSERSHY